MEQLDINKTVEDEALRFSEDAKEATRNAEEAKERRDSAAKAWVVANGIMHAIKGTEPGKFASGNIFGIDSGELHAEVLSSAERDRAEAHGVYKESDERAEKKINESWVTGRDAGMHYYRNQGQYEDMAINDAVEAGRTITLQNPETGERKEFSQENPTGLTLHDS